jgi:hypothetical protein
MGRGSKRGKGEAVGGNLGEVGEVRLPVIEDLMGTFFYLSHDQTLAVSGMM